MDHLLIPFAILLVGITISTPVFLLELYVFKGKHLARNNSREKTTDRMYGNVSPPSEKPDVPPIEIPSVMTARAIAVVERC